MPRENTYANTIDIIRRKLEKESEKIINEKGKITPYHITEALKEPVEGGDEFTCIGSLIKESLGDSKYIDVISWIAFHFDFPGQEFSYSERDARNWISVRSDKQKLLDAIHETVRENYYEIQDIYAPSVTLAQISKLYSGNKEVIKNFQERWWLYHFADYYGAEPRPYPFRDVSQNKELEGVELICFRENISPEETGVTLTSPQPFFQNCKTYSLAKLLNEAEEETFRKFQRFKNIIYESSDDKTSLNCDFYARIPLFFYGTEQKYTTEVFVALNHKRKDGVIQSKLKVDEVIHILDTIAPSLKLCVSLINSQAAYSIGEVTRMDKMAGLLRAVIRHDINNFAAAVDGSMSQLLEYREVMTEEDISEILQEMRSSLALYTMSIDLDFIWGDNRKNLRDSLASLNEIRDELDRSWRFSTITGCDFNGDWTKQVLVPRVCRVVLSNLLRNAIDKNEDARIIMDCQAAPEKISFGCLSEAPISDVLKRQTFEKPLSYKAPSHNLGLWICRHIAESLKGKFYLDSPQKNYKTHIRFDIPTFRY